MSRGNLLQGQASGKLGGTVLMVRNGQQLARVYTTSGARSGESASEASRIQRVSFGAASNQWNLYRYICTRMYRRGRTASQSDYNYFVKRNNALLPYLDKIENRDGVHCLQPGIFSEGNLGRIDLMHSVSVYPAEHTASVKIMDLNLPSITAVAWTDVLSKLKSVLASAYPLASKVSYVFSIPREETITDEGETFLSQSVKHHVITIDLYKESTPGENESAVNTYFASKIDSGTLHDVIAAATENIVGPSYLMRVPTAVESEINFVKSIGVLLFATDNLVSDCYTTVLDENSVPVSEGAYSVWAGYRTNDALRAAAESYGFQAGVMKDKIASRVINFEAQQQNYVARLAKVDSTAAAAVKSEIESAGGVKIRSVRRAEEPSDE